MGRGQGGHCHAISWRHGCPGAPRMILAGTFIQVSRSGQLLGGPWFGYAPFYPSYFQIIIHFYPAPTHKLHHLYVDWRLILVQDRHSYFSLSSVVGIFVFKASSSDIGCELIKSLSQTNYLIIIEKIFTNNKIDNSVITNTSN